MLRPSPRHERVKVIPTLSAAAAPPLAADTRPHVSAPAVPVVALLLEPDSDLARPRPVLSSALQVAVTNQYEATVCHKVKWDPPLLTTPQLP